MYNQLNLNFIDYDILEEINRRERQILVHSCIYYDLNYNILEDYQYDNIAKRLAKLTQEYPVEFNQSVYHDIFKDFGQPDENGNVCYSGFNIPHDQPEIFNTAMRLIRYHQQLE